MPEITICIARSLLSAEQVCASQIVDKCSELSAVPMTINPRSSLFAQTKLGVFYSFFAMLGSETIIFPGVNL